VNHHYILRTNTTAKGRLYAVYSYLASGDKLVGGAASDI
jgi:hypothetical protein